MGGLMKKMPVTGLTFLVGVLAIAGFGLPGVSVGDAAHPIKFGLGGFFSKDEILAVAYARSFEWDDPHKHQLDHGGGHALISEARGLDGAVTPVNAASEVRLVSDPQPKTVAGDSPHGLKTAAHSSGHDFARVFQNTPALPKWMFWLAIVTAYITPFYMMRAWWLTFMGKPRDEHVHHHAHESPLMFVPLAVLAVGTLVSSYFLFRPLIADAAQSATAAPLALALDGEAHTEAIHAAHHWLVFGVGGAFVVGFAIAILIYRNGLGIAGAIRRAVGPLHTLLERKYYFDEVYDFVLVKGCVLVAQIARLIDTYVVDLVFNLLAAATERFAAFSGLILDHHGVDGVVNGIAKTSMDVGDMMRRPQTGRIRHYVLFAAGAATVVLIVLLMWESGSGGAAAAAVG